MHDSRGPFGLLGQKSATFPWQPTRIADDGAHVYVSLPPLARKYPSPVLYALEDDGSRTIVNYNLRDTVIVTDRLFKRGVLVIPSGNEEQRLVFENRAWYDVPQRGEKR
jgi:type IV secretory pathway VirB9-like protein